MLQKVFFYIRKHNNKISHESTYQIYVLLLYQCLCIVTIGVLAHFSPPTSTEFALTFPLPSQETLVINPLSPTHTHTHTRIPTTLMYCTLLLGKHTFN